MKNNSKEILVHNGDLTATLKNKDYCDRVVVITGAAYAYVEGAFPLLTTCNSASASAKGAFPLLTTCNYAYVSAKGAFPLLEITKFDGISCKVISEKIIDELKIIKCKKPKFLDKKCIGDVFYVVSKNDKFAHGKTVKKAIEELVFKSKTRDIEQYRHMKLDIKKTPIQWGYIYREITGACQLGTEFWIESKGKLKPLYSLQEILELTKAAYGFDVFNNCVK